MIETAEIASGGSNIWAALGGVIVTIISGGLYVRTKLSKDGTQIASYDAEKGMLTFFSRELEKFAVLVETERKARLVAEERADRFAQERNELVKEVGGLNGKIMALEAAIAALTQDLQDMRQRYEGAGK